MNIIIFTVLICLIILIMYFRYRICIIKNNIKILKYWLYSIDIDILNNSIHDKRYFMEALRVLNKLCSNTKHNKKESK